MDIAVYCRCVHKRQTCSNCLGRFLWGSLKTAEICRKQLHDIMVCCCLELFLNWILTNALFLTTTGSGRYIAWFVVFVVSLYSVFYCYLLYVLLLFIVFMFYFLFCVFCVVLYIVSSYVCSFFSICVQAYGLLSSYCRQMAVNIIYHHN